MVINRLYYNDVVTGNILHTWEQHFLAQYAIKAIMQILLWYVIFILLYYFFKSLYCTLYYLIVHNIVVYNSIFLYMYIIFWGQNYFNLRT